MKYKIFLTVWFTFIFTLITSSLIYSQFLNSERIRLIDSQIESYASLLSRGEFIGRDFEGLEEAEDEIQSILGGYKINLVLIIRNSRGKILYRNLNAKKLEINPGYLFEWQFANKDDTTLRLYTKKIPENNRILQIGTVINTKYVSSSYFSRNQIFYFILLVLFSSAVSYFLSSRVLIPMKNLADNLTVITKQLHTPESMFAKIRSHFFPKKKPFLNLHDEFIELTNSLEELLKQIKIAFEHNKNQSARLAHEVNTPLSLIKNKIKKLENENNFSEIQDIHKDIERLAEFVHRYLRISETLNTPAQKTDIYAIKLNSFLEDFKTSMSSLGHNRIQISGQGNPTLFANTHDFEHLLQNLITNALKYSPQDRNVYLNFKEDEMEIIDEGPGIPTAVLEKIGTPFNVGPNNKKSSSTGLGLAWVHSIVQKYNWNIHYESTSTGTRVKIHFNNLS